MWLMTGFAIHDAWPILTGSRKDYDLGGIITFGSMLLVANIVLLGLALYCRMKEVRQKAKQAAIEVFTPEPAPHGVDAFSWFDFKTRFPHKFWISTVCYDRDDPNGFRFKLLATRLEPGKEVELVLLRQSEETGIKRQLFHMRRTLDGHDDSIEELCQQLQCKNNVEFEMFDLSAVQTSQEFKCKASQLGWDSAILE